jgi:tetratricopeptide (TPR) repeat protein
MKVRNYFLIGIFLVALCGCESREFKAERQMWRAHKRAQAIYKNPKGTPPFQLAQVQKEYQKIIDKNPKSLFSVQAQFSIGHLYLVVGDFERARSEYKKLDVECDKRGNLCAEAIFAIGQSYELEEKWSQALVQYKNILTSFPFSSKSLDLPIYIIRHYQRTKDAAGINRSCDEALAYYASLKSKTKAERGGYILDSLIARSLIEAGRWQEAVDALEKTVTRYPNMGADETLVLKAVIYKNKLKDSAKAKEELQRMLKDYPKSKLTKKAKDFLAQL